MATKDRTSLKNDFANGKYATGEKFADLIDSMKVVQLPVVDPQALGTSLSFIDSISQDADGKITATKKTLDLANARELNPFKGWYKTGDTLPTDGFDGAYLYFKDTSELTGQTTIYRWNGTTYADTGTVVDTSNVNTFETGQAVNEVAIDGTGLANPAPNALAKAGDVMRMKSQLEGITLKETKATDYSTWHPSGKNNGYYKTDGTWVNSSNYTYVKIDVSGYRRVRFIGMYADTSSQLTYSWLDANENRLSTVLLDRTSTGSVYFADYIRDVPSGAAYLLVLNKYATYLSTFYCYLQNGDTVNDKINNAAGVPVALDTSFSKDASRKVITSDFVRDGVLAGTYEKEVIDVSHMIQMPLSMVEDTGYWGNSGTSHKHTFVLVNPGDILYVKSNSTYSCLIGFVTDYNIHKQSPIGLTTGTTLERYNEGYILVPDSAKVALIYLGADNAQLPEKLILYKKVINRPKDFQIQPITFRGVNISGDEVTYDWSYSGIMLLIPTDFTAIVAVHKSSGSSNTTSKYSEGYRYINTNEGKTTEINHGGTSGIKELQFGVKAAGSGVCYMFSSTNVTDIDVETSYNADAADGEDAQFKALFDNATFSEITASSGVAAKGISSVDGFYFNTDSKIFSVIPRHIYKVTANETYAGIVAFLTQSDSSAAANSLPSYCEASSVLLIPNGTSKYFVAPQDATYMNIRFGTYAPAFIGEYVPGGEGGASKKDYLFFKSDFRAKKAQEAALVQQTEIGTSGNDSDGYAMPKTLQEQNVIKKTKQFAYIKWTPKATFYGKTTSKVYQQGVEQTSIPYSNNYDDCKQIGQTVSIHTFMTAVNNPYSVLYTERVKKGDSASAWGRTYNGPNGYAYYGTVCCMFASYVDGYRGLIGNNMWQAYANRFGLTCQKFNRGEVDPQLLRIGDVLDNVKHSYIITGIKKDANGNVTYIRWAESSGSATGTHGGCAIGKETLTNFVSNRVQTNEGDTAYPMAVFSLNDFARNTEFVDYPEYVVINNDPEQTKAAAQPAEPAPYNNDICTIYGDKATLAEGYRVVLNYNLTGTPSHEWTAIEVYKDDVLIDTYQLSAIDQTALPVSQQGHALDLGNELEAGMYKARMTDGTNYSEYTFWEIVSNDVTIVKIENGVYKVTNNTGKRLIECALGSYVQGDTLGMERVESTSYGIYGLLYPLSRRDINYNNFTLYLKDYLADFGLSTDLNLNKKVLKLVVQGEYSAVATAVLFLPDVDYGLSSSNE